MQVSIISSKIGKNNRMRMRTHWTQRKLNLSYSSTFISFKSDWWNERYYGGKNFLLEPGFMDPRIKWWKWKWHHSLLTLVTQCEIIAFCHHDLMLCWPRSLSSKRKKKMLTPGDTTLNWNLRLALSHTGLFMPLERQGETKGKKEFQCLSEMVDSDWPGKNWTSSPHG